MEPPSSSAGALKSTSSHNPPAQGPDLNRGVCAWLERNSKMPADSGTSAECLPFPQSFDVTRSCCDNEPCAPPQGRSPLVLVESNKVPVVQPSHAVHPLTPLITYSDEHFAPGSHSGLHPQDINNKQGRDQANRSDHDSLYNKRGSWVASLSQTTSSYSSDSCRGAPQQFGQAPQPRAAGDFGNFSQMQKDVGPTIVMSRTLSLLLAFFSCGCQLKRRGIRQDVGDDEDDDEAGRF
ncbi:hypothetical protein FQN60_011850 [Etheostoma spectabile]|uniref:CTNNB1 binding N-teminal domain-containing protein n=1 Tax=Etheostoma spectabile TaxID=54343 RepID=A0A5J5DN03_9PERO|nr:hypothetical protein FQN60_011850 [Etheostoma spectabile]